MTMPHPSVYETILPTRMQLLRLATRTVHARIEASLPLLDPGLTLESYRGILEAFYGYFVTLEPVVVAAAGDHGVAIDLDRRAKTPLLVLDLKVLGATVDELNALPRCPELPRVVGASQALGALYVFEGATLGGQIIGARLRTTLGLQADDGAAFFAAYGDQTRAMWQRFAEYVDTAVDIDTDVASRTAVATFETLQRWLEVARLRSRA